MNTVESFVVALVQLRDGSTWVALLESTPSGRKLALRPAAELGRSGRHTTIGHRLGHDSICAVLTALPLHCLLATYPDDV